MKKLYCIAILLIISVSIIFVSNRKALSNGNEIKNDIQYDIGVVLVNGEPKYLDPCYLEVPNVNMSIDYINKLDYEIIKAGNVLFLGNSRLVIYDINKNRPNIPLIKTKRELKYKVENQTLYVSSNGTRWEPVKFKVINDQPHKDKYDSSVTIYWVVYLECRWFKGEYEIFSIPNA